MAWHLNMVVSPDNPHQRSRYLGSRLTICHSGLLVCYALEAEGAGAVGGSTCARTTLVLAPRPGALSARPSERFPTLPPASSSGTSSPFSRELWTNSLLQRRNLR